ncbi:hypothetical protein Tco_0937554 [Tanacetum coccineum]|uniref:Uncharacterized protein n=1 Tax=Tanacetum coccineum TaxID=301880 RepID=A0ABQ5DLM4_9ASTR
MLRTLIKEHDQQGQAKATPKRLNYDNSEKDDSESSRARNSLECSSDGSSRTMRTRSKTRTTRKNQRSFSRSKTPSRPRRSGRLEGKSGSKAKLKDVKTKLRPRRSEHRGNSLDSSFEGDSEDTSENMSTPYKRPKPTPFTSRITRFRHHRRAKLPKNMKVNEGSKDLEDHLGFFFAVAE